MVGLSVALGFSRTRGQLSIEFLFIVSFLLALAAVLLNTAETQLKETEALDNAALSKVAADSMATWINTVYIHGNSSQVKGEIFVPPSSVCFFINTTDSNNVFLECDPDPQLSGKVASRQLYTSSITLASSCPPTVASGGWFRVTVRNAIGAVTVNCTRVS